MANPDKRIHATFRRGMTRRAILGSGLGLLALPLLQACAPQETPTPAAAPPKAAAQPTPTTAAKPAAAATPTAAAKPAAAATPTAAAKPAAATPTTAPAAAAKPTALGKIGGNVTVMAVWGGEEQDSFLAMVKPFEEQTGVNIQYEGTRDINAVLETRIQGGNPPEVAGLPGPGRMAEFARAGRLVDLSPVLDMSKLRDEYVEDFVSLGQVDNKQFGIFIKSAIKGNVWYNPKVFQQRGFQVPKTWDDLTKLSQQMVQTNIAPWTIGLESGAASGWPGTDWIEDIVLRQAGPEVYDQWHQGQVKWTSPEIRRAWETWGTIVGDPKMVFGGEQYMLSTNFGEAPNPLFTEPPGAYMHHQASFITTFITDNNPQLKPVEDFTFFMFPDIDPKFTGSVVGAGDLFGAFKDTPQSRALMQYLTTADAQAIWVQRGGALAPNKKVPLDAYPDQLSKQSAQILYGAKNVRFDASDLMPETVNKTFWQSVLDFVADTSKLDQILQNLDRVQAEANQRA